MRDKRREIEGDIEAEKELRKDLENIQQYGTDNPVLVERWKAMDEETRRMLYEDFYDPDEGFEDKVDESRGSYANGYDPYDDYDDDYY